MKISKSKIENWLPHLIGLLLFALIPIFVFDRDNEKSLFWIYNYFHQLIFMVIAFYINYLVLVPKLFFPKKRISFLITTFLFALILVFVNQFSYQLFSLDSFRPEKIHINKPMHEANILGIHPRLADNFILIIIILGFSTGMAIVRRLKSDEDEQKELEKAKVDSELAFLKNQINPHFFFNSLNNIYALIAIDVDKAQQAVEKLSHLMRYLIYDSNTLLTNLSKEVEFTEKFIELMKLRLSTKVRLDISFPDDLPKVNVPPLLFICFVENAFKHGISYREKTYISLKLTINKESNNLCFSCENSIPVKRTKEAEKGGFGINNIRKRLALIYNDFSVLTIDRSTDIFKVLLTLPLEWSDDEKN